MGGGADKAFANPVRSGRKQPQRMILGSLPSPTLTNDAQKNLHTDRKVHQEWRPPTPITRF